MNATVRSWSRQTTFWFSSWPPCSRNDAIIRARCSTVVPECAGLDALELFLALAEQLAQPRVVEQQPSRARRRSSVAAGQYSSILGIGARAPPPRPSQPCRHPLPPIGLLPCQKTFVFRRTDLAVSFNHPVGLLLQDQGTFEPQRLGVLRLINVGCAACHISLAGMQPYVPIDYLNFRLSRLNWSTDRQPISFISRSISSCRFLRALWTPA